MISQFAFAGGGVAAVADGQGVVLADAVGAGAALEPSADAAGAGAALEPSADAAGAGIPLELAPDGVGAGADAEDMPEAVKVGTADPVALEAAAGLPVSLAETGVAEADRTLLSATAMGIPATAADLAGLADPAAAGAAQLPARLPVLLATVSMALICGALMVAIPARSATVRSPIIGTRRAGRRSGKSRYLRASRRRYERTLR